MDLHPGKPPLDFDAWCALSTRMTGLSAEERDVTLEQADVEVDAWEASDAHWILTLAAEFRKGNRGRATAYAQACAEELKRRAADPPAEPASAPPQAVDSPQAPATPEPPPPPEHPPIVPSRMEGLPSYLLTILEPPPSAPPAPIALRSVDETADAIPSIRAALPFGSTPSPGFLEAPPASRVPQSHSIDETMTIAAVVVDFGPSLPFEQRNREELPTLTVQQFASMCVELQADPDRSAEIARRYGCSVESAGKLHREWAQKLAKDHALLDVFRSAVARYRGWLLGWPRQ